MLSEREFSAIFDGFLSALLGLVVLAVIGVVSILGFGVFVIWKLIELFWS